jgi:formylglycine-generating enzyme required for sulfatase activity
MLRTTPEFSVFSILMVVTLIAFAHLPGCGDDDGGPTCGAPEESDPPGSIPGMVLVPAGTFMMGSPDTELGRGLWETRHEVTLTKAFHLHEHEVMQPEWERVMGWNESFEKGSRLPVDRLTWFDAIEYCNRLSESEGLSPAYSLTHARTEGVHIVTASVTWDPEGLGYRLPTEAEWEYACRAGSETAFANGEIVHVACDPIDPNLDAIGWYCGNSGIHSHEVMQKSPNDWGLYDMHGNASEWVWDYPDQYDANPVIDPVGREFGNTRVIRGGTWYAHYDGTFTYGSELCRSAHRDFSRASAVLIGVGLRVARTAP